MLFDEVLEGVVHVASGVGKIIVENALVQVLLFGEQGKCPNSPEEVVEEAAVKNLSEEWFVVLGEEHLNVSLEVDISDVLVHVLIEVVGQVCFDEAFQLILRHDVVSVPFDTVLTWVRVVVHCLVDEDGDIHCHRIPTSVLVINDNEVAVVHD